MRIPQWLPFGGGSLFAARRFDIRASALVCVVDVSGLRWIDAVRGIHCHPAWCVVVAVLIIAVAAALFVQDTSAHPSRNYARGKTYMSITGIEGRIDTANPNLGGTIFSNATLWVVDYDTCSPYEAWLETGWSKSTQWAGQVRYKFMYSVAPTCTFTVWPLNLGAPALASWHDYRLIFSSSQNRWNLYIDGVLRAFKSAFVLSDYFQVGGEVPATFGGTIGPSHYQNLTRQLTSNGQWGPVVFFDEYHCDIDAVTGQGYNLIHPVQQHDWIYVWTVLAGGGYLCWNP